MTENQTLLPCPKHAFGMGNNESERNTVAWFSDCPTCNSGIRTSAPIKREEGCQKCDAEMLRVKMCEHIAEGEEGWNRAECRNVCPSTMAVAELRDKYETSQKILQEILHESKNPTMQSGEYCEFVIRKIESAQPDNSIESRINRSREHSAGMVEAVAKAIFESRHDDWEEWLDKETYREFCEAAQAAIAAMEKFIAQPEGGMPKSE